MFFSGFDSESRATFVRFGVLCARLRVVALFAEPLKVGRIVVVAGGDVVAFGAYPVAAWCVVGGLALVVGSASGLGAEGVPVGGEPFGSGAGGPCHYGHLPWGDSGALDVLMRDITISAGVLAGVDVGEVVVPVGLVYPVAFDPPAEGRHFEAGPDGVYLGGGDVDAGVDVGVAERGADAGGCFVSAVVNDQFAVGVGAGGFIVIPFACGW